MNQESIVYGYICTNSILAPEDKRQSIISNTQVINGLPSFDSGSLLLREMFSVPRMQYDEGLQSALIHFAHAYHGIEYEWGSWMQAFEGLLKKMQWDSVIVHLETELSGTHTFQWDSGDHSHTPGVEPLNIRCEWQHEIGLQS